MISSSKRSHFQHNLQALSILFFAHVIVLLVVISFIVFKQTLRQLKEPRLQSSLAYFEDDAGKLCADNLNEEDRPAVNIDFIIRRQHWYVIDASSPVLYVTMEDLKKPVRYVWSLDLEPGDDPDGLLDRYSRAELEAVFRSWIRAESNIASWTPPAGSISTPVTQELWSKRVYAAVDSTPSWMWWLGITSWLSTCGAWLLLHPLVRVRQGRCRICGYSLKGLTSPICPECGEKSNRRRLS